MKGIKVAELIKSEIGGVSEVDGLSRILGMGGRVITASSVLNSIDTITWSKKSETDYLVNASDGVFIIRVRGGFVGHKKC